MPMTPKRAVEIMYEVSDTYARDFDHMDDLRDTIRADMHDLRAIAVLINENKLAEAKEAVYNLDTLVRDYVPSNVYKWLKAGG